MNPPVATDEAAVTCTGTVFTRVGREGGEADEVIAPMTAGAPPDGIDPEAVELVETRLTFI